MYKRQLPMQDLIIYELHVRGYTKHGSSGVKFPGTFEGLKEKIPYLVELGVNAVELMPIFEFDEMLDYREVDGEKLSGETASRDVYKRQIHMGIMEYLNTVGNRKANGQ